MRVPCWGTKSSDMDILDGVGDSCSTAAFGGANPPHLQGIETMGSVSFHVSSFDSRELGTASSWRLGLGSLRNCTVFALSVFIAPVQPGLPT